MQGINRKLVVPPVRVRNGEVVEEAVLDGQGGYVYPSEAQSPTDLSTFDGKPVVCKNTLHIEREVTDLTVADIVRFPEDPNAPR
jgi:hypothetical protein